MGNRRDSDGQYAKRGIIKTLECRCDSSKEKYVNGASLSQCMVINNFSHRTPKGFNAAEIYLLLNTLSYCMAVARVETRIQQFIFCLKMTRLIFY